MERDSGKNSVVKMKGNSLKVETATNKNHEKSPQKDTKTKPHKKSDTKNAKRKNYHPKSFNLKNSEQKSRKPHNEVGKKIQKSQSLRHKRYSSEEV